MTVRNPTVGTELFRPVQYVATVDTSGPSLHGEHVRTRIRLGKAQASDYDLIGISEFGYPTLLLLLCAAQCDGSYGHIHRVNADRDPSTSPGELFGKDELGKVIEALPAVF